MDCGCLTSSKQNRDAQSTWACALLRPVPIFAFGGSLTHDLESLRLTGEHCPDCLGFVYPLDALAMGRLLSPSAHDLKPQFQHCGYCDEVACIVKGVSDFSG